MKHPDWLWLEQHWKVMIPEAVAKAMKDKGLNTYELARRIPCDTTLILGVLRGRFSMTTLAKVFHALDLDLVVGAPDETR